MRKKSFRIFSGMAMILCTACMVSAAEKNVPMEALDDFDLTLDLPEETADAPALPEVAEVKEADVEDILPPPIAELPATKNAPAENDDVALQLDDVLAEAPEPIQEAKIETILPEVDADPIVEIAQGDTDVVDAEIAPAPEAVQEAVPTPIAQALPAPEPAANAADANIADAAVVADDVAVAAPKVAEAAVAAPKVAPQAAPAPVAKAAPAPNANSVVSNQPLPQNAVVQQSQVPLPESNGMVPGTVSRNCRNCQNGGYVVPNPGPGKKAIIYGVQRNGVNAYPRRECPCRNCGDCGPMPYPYYTLRGPRDFDDPNPRPIGP